MKVSDTHTHTFGVGRLQDQNLYHNDVGCAARALDLQHGCAGQTTDERLDFEVCVGFILPELMDTRRFRLCHSLFRHIESW